MDEFQVLVGKVFKEMSKNTVTKRDALNELMQRKNNLQQWTTRQIYENNENDNKINDIQNMYEKELAYINTKIDEIVEMIKVDDLLNKVKF